MVDAEANEMAYHDLPKGNAVVEVVEVEGGARDLQAT